MLGTVDRGDQKILKAQLQRDGHDIIPPLIDVRVTRITRNGMVIKGREMESRVPGSSKARITMYEQTWWALVHTDDYQDLHEAADPIEEADDHPFITVAGPSNTAAAPDARPAWQVRNSAGGGG